MNQLKQISSLLLTCSNFTYISTCHCWNRQLIHRSILLTVEKLNLCNQHTRERTVLFKQSPFWVANTSHCTLAHTHIWQCVIWIRTAHSIFVNQNVKICRIITQWIFNCETCVFGVKGTMVSCIEWKSVCVCVKEWVYNHSRKYLEPRTEPMTRRKP